MKNLFVLPAILLSLNTFGAPVSILKPMLIYEIADDLSLPLSKYITSNDLYKFFTQETIGFVGFMAHPTSTFSHGKVLINGENVYVNIWYKEGEAVELCFKYSFGLFTGVRVISDTDFFPAFLAITGMKELFEPMIHEMNKEELEMMSNFERYLGKVWDDFKGEDITCMLLTIGNAIN